MTRSYEKWSENLTHHKPMTLMNQDCARRNELQVDHELLRLHLPKKPDQSNQRYLLTQWPLGAERPKATESGVSPDQSVWPINLSLSLPFVLLSCLGFIPQSHFPFCNRPLLILFAHSFSLFIAWRRLLQIQSKIRFQFLFPFSNVVRRVKKQSILQFMHCRIFSNLVSLGTFSVLVI